jgi:hypothetical protein
MRGLLTIALTVGLAAQSYPPAFPRANVTNLMENDRIAVWDIAWPKGQPTPMHRHLHDQVGTYYAPGGRAITTPDGATRQTTTEIGALSTTKKGTTHIEEGTTNPPLRAVFIELKQDRPSGSAETPSRLPPVFPRGGATQLLDDERVTVWDYTWKPGVHGALSRYPRDTVIVWLAKGTMRVTPEGKPAAMTAVSPGKMQFYAGGSAEVADAVDGSPRAMIFAFK